MTALTYAIVFGNEVGAELLINAGANINLCDPVTRRTPLMLAVIHEQVNIVKLLINANADIGAKDTLENNALTYAKRNQNPVFIDLLEKSLSEKISLRR